MKGRNVLFACAPLSAIAIVTVLAVLPRDETCVYRANATADSEPRQVSSRWGIALAIVAAGVNSVGMHIQKVAHMKLDAAQSSVAHFTSGRWWQGFACILLAEAFGAVSYGFAPAAIVSVLGALVIVGTGLLARLQLNERYSWLQIAGVAEVLVGVALLSIATPATTQLLSESQLAATLTRTDSVLWMIFAASVSVTLVVLWRNEVIANARRRMAVLATAAAVTSSFTVLSVRGIVAIAADIPADCRNCGCANTLRSPLTVILVLITIVTAVVSGGWIEQTGLRSYKETIWIPTHFVACSIAFGTASAIVYDDMQGLEGKSAFVLSFGALLVLSGVFAVAGFATDV